MGPVCAAFAPHLRRNRFTPRTCLAHGVLEVVVAEGAQKPYRCKEGFYLRQGATKQKLSTAEIRQLVLQAGGFRFDESVNQHFRYPHDFDQNRYRAYLQAAGIRIQARPEDLLASLDAAVPAAAGISLRQGGVMPGSWSAAVSAKRPSTSAPGTAPGDRYDRYPAARVCVDETDQVGKARACGTKTSRAGAIEGGRRPCTDATAVARAPEHRARYAVS